MKNTIYFLILIPFLFSCVQELKFEEAQPAHSKNEQKFKKKYQGKYQQAEGVKLSIEEGLMYREWQFISTMLKSELDTLSGVEIKGGLLYPEDQSGPFPVRYEGDSAFINVEYSDTLFEFSSSQVLRYYKGRYFLNYEQKDGLWSLRVLQLNKGGRLSLNKIYGGEDELSSIMSMTSIEEVQSETGEPIGHKINPTKKELKQLLRSSPFQGGTDFIKLEE